MTVVEVAAVLRQAMAIYGESYETKMAAMMAAFADTPPGDVIEIGTLSGRSAAVLLLMARRHKTGSVLAIDPWNTTESRQTRSPSRSTPTWTRTAFTTDKSEPW